MEGLDEKLPDSASFERTAAERICVSGAGRRHPMTRRRSVLRRFDGGAASRHEDG